MPVQTRSTTVKAPAILDPDSVPVEALSTNEKATLNLLVRVDLDRPLKGSSVKGLVRKCNSKHECALCVNLKPSDSFHSSLTHRKYVTKCNDKNINTLNCSTSNCYT